MSSIIISVNGRLALFLNKQERVYEGNTPIHGNFLYILIYFVAFF